MKIKHNCSPARPFGVHRVSRRVVLHRKLFHANGHTPAERIDREIEAHKRRVRVDHAWSLDFDPELFVDDGEPMIKSEPLELPTDGQILVDFEVGFVLIGSYDPNDPTGAYVCTTYQRFEVSVGEEEDSEDSDGALIDALFDALGDKPATDECPECYCTLGRNGVCPQCGRGDTLHPGDAFDLAGHMRRTRAQLYAVR